MFQFSYTFSKSTDNSSNYRDIVPDTYNTSNLWGPSEYDARHMIVINYLWEIPVFKNHATLAGKLLGGWQLSGTAQFQTGSPCGVGTNNDFAGVSSTDLGSFGCGSQGQFWVLNGLPQITGAFAPGIGANANSPKYFTANYTQPAAGTFNLQPGVRDAIYGPGFQDWNLALFKRFTINDRNTFEFRAEAYSVFNHPNWAAIGSTGGLNLNPTSKYVRRSHRHEHSRSQLTAFASLFVLSANPAPAPINTSGGSVAFAPDCDETSSIRKQCAYS